MGTLMQARALPLIIALALALASCESPRPRLEPAKPAPPPVVIAPPAPPPAPVEPDRPGLTLQDYQKEIATAIVSTSSGETFQGKLPPLLRSVVVLQVSIDKQGMPDMVTLFRSNGFADLEKLAVAAVYRAAPYPIPGRSLLAGRSSLSFTESFLFRNDGRFQVRSIAEEQSTHVEPQKPAARKAAKKK
ncbi:MAG: energy transducer TonB [Betaproteobacteria bacterium]|nr:energy transducer TonB [Betaproteobacteria bacterium]